MITAESIGEALNGKKSGKSWMCCCPAHDDKNPSLSVSDGDYAPLVHCFAGCESIDVIAILRERGIWPSSTPAQLDKFKLKKAKEARQHEQTKVMIADNMQANGTVLTPVAKIEVQEARDKLATDLPTENKWSDPMPLTASVDPEPYPLLALPDVIRSAVEEVLSFTKAPAPLVASSALAAISLAIQAHVDVKRAENLTGPVGLFLLTIADSGERKSTCDGYFMQAIKEYEAKQAEEAKPLLKDFVATKEAWEAKRAGIKEKVKALAKTGKPTQEWVESLRDNENEKPEPPRIPRLIYADATPEALKWSLAKSWPSGGVMSSEAGLVFGGAAMKSDSVMRNLATLNQLWDGADIATERKTSESFTVRGARLTIALQVQEATLRSFFVQSGGLARGSGFLARFLVAMPESTQGYRPYSEPPTAWPALDKFNKRIEEILDQSISLDDGALSPQMLLLATDAKSDWITFHDDIENQLRPDGDLYDVRDVASKIPDNASRIAALFQVFESGDTGAIGLDAFERAAIIADWHLKEARRFYGELALSEEQTDTVRLNDWLVKYCQRARTSAITRREIQSHVGSVRLRKGPALDNALAELIEAGRVRFIYKDKTKQIQINPVLLEGYT